MEIGTKLYLWSRSYGDEITARIVTVTKVLKNGNLRIDGRTTEQWSWRGQNDWGHRVGNRGFHDRTSLRPINDETTAQLEASRAKYERRNMIYAIQNALKHPDAVKATDETLRAVHAMLVKGE